MKRHNFFLPTELVADLKAIAAQRKTTLSEIIRQAMLEYVNGRRVPTDNTNT